MKKVSGPLGPICRYWPTQDHEAAQLRDWARMLRGEPFTMGDELRANIKEKNWPMPTRFMSELDCRALAAYLERRAVAVEATPAARGPGRPPDPQRQYVLCTDYLATYERVGKDAAAISEVMKAHGVERTVVTDAKRLWMHDARAEIGRLAEAHPGMSRAELLKAISEQLRQGPGNSVE